MASAFSVSELDVRQQRENVRFSVRVKPRSSKTAILGIKEGVLELKVQAPPVDGLANAEVIKVLAKKIGCPTRQVSLVAGDTGRLKIVEISGVTLEVVRASLQGDSEQP
jgi:uncharacterized protein